MSDDPFLKRYIGANAEIYDKKRVSTPRFLAEERALAKLFALASPQSVLDCPIGTGRGLTHYKDAQRIIGIDLSADMLAQARAKIDPQKDVTLLVGSVFDPALFAGLEPVDTVLCMRFLAWLSMTDVERAFANFARVAKSRLVIGAVVEKRGPLALWWSVLRRIDSRRRRRAGAAHSYTHREADILRAFAQKGWTVLQREPTFTRRGRVGYLYLLDAGSQRAR